MLLSVLMLACAHVCTLSSSTVANTAYTQRVHIAFCSQSGAVTALCNVGNVVRCS
jgi:hypothetical protein